MSFGDGYTCQIEGISTVSIKLSDGMVRELKDMRYVPQLKNLISIGGLEAQGLGGTLGEGVLKISSGSVVVLKGIRRNNLYYLKSSAVTRNLVTSERFESNKFSVTALPFKQYKLLCRMPFRIINEPLNILRTPSPRVSLRPCASKAPIKIIFFFN